MRIKVLVIVLGVLLPLPFAAGAFADVSATDFQGREIRLNKPAERIIALAPHIVENTFSAGAGDKLIGVVSYSDYPAEATKIAEIGNYKSWSLETIVALQPDLILMWGSGNPMGTLKSFERLNIPVYVSEPRNLSDIAKAIRAIGVLAGTESTSEPEAMRIEQNLAKLAKKYRALKSLTVLYQVWNEPLQTLNGEHMISSVMHLCGGQNAFADAASLAPKIGIESVIQRNPDAIIASGMGTAKPDWLDKWKRYPSLKAVKNNALFFIQPDHIQRSTARILLGAESMCQQLDSLRARTDENNDPVVAVENGELNSSKYFFQRLFK